MTGRVRGLMVRIVLAAAFAAAGYALVVFAIVVRVQGALGIPA